MLEKRKRTNLLEIPQRRNDFFFFLATYIPFDLLRDSVDPICRNVLTL